MSQYEIMMILAPAENENVAKDMLTSTFKSGKVTKFEVLDRTELAYEINKSKVAKYVLALVESSDEKNEVAEFVRKANISKSVWRHLVVNLTTERGINKPATPLPARELKVRRENTKEESSEVKRSYTPRKVTSQNKKAA
ncbi:30S ribosomal protein S6 [Mycoplasmopsis agassizii]|uniref:Small ribosomal subunit protein bS6 n=1 Tax=Mycoplasmopsis agassizii TaxID=33922 RepID=A0A269TJ97_9BACT|nr:30S ribosomal protein S6 [Mycoplasmopsis agassizii]PAK20958.1 30S ribosomal protein S6 [Mycoplasmopsis agassizii]